jgi:hypothetical protein
MENTNTKREIKELLKRKFRISYRQMILDILEFVEDDFSFEMDCKVSLPGKDGKPREFTQEEAIEMARRLGSIYSIAHCEHCSACAERYRTK